MAFVPELGGFLMVGGGFSEPAFNQTWIYSADRNNWTRLDSGAMTPPGRLDAALSYAANVHKVVLFGGLGLSGHGICPRNDTWLFDPVQRTWTNVTPPQSPSARRAHAMVYDNNTHRIVLFGGHAFNCGFRIPEATGPRLADTWLYDPITNTWTNRTYPGGPPARSGAGLVYVPGLTASVLFGGRVAELYAPSPVVGDTWTFDSFSFRWTELLPFNPPSARTDLGMAYVPSAHVALLYGGCDPTACSRDTWWYDPEIHEWLERSSSAGPEFGPGAAFASDPRGVIVAFGHSTTWQYWAGGVPNLVARPWASGVSETTPEMVAFHADVTGGVPPYAYLWSFGDRAKSVDANPVHSYVVAGNYHISLRVRDASGNSTVVSFGVTIYPQLIPSGGLSPAAVGGIALALGVALLSGWFWWKRRPRPPNR